MKTKFRLILAALAALFLCSCAGQSLVVRTPLGNARIGVAGGGQGYGSNGPPQRYAGDGHSGPPGRRLSYSRDRQYAQEDREVFEGRGQARLINGGGEYNRSTWLKGVDRHGLHVRATISAFKGSLTMEERPALGKKLEDWAEKVYDKSNKKHIPSDKEAQQELQRMLGHDLNGPELVRVKLTDRVSDEFISQERKLISREKFDVKDVPQESAAELQKRAIEQFKAKGTNDMVTDGRYYNKP